jgi:hypothetical protein
VLGDDTILLLCPRDTATVIEAITWFDGAISEIQRWLECGRQEIERFNEMVSEDIRSAILSYRELESQHKWARELGFQTAWSDRTPVPPIVPAATGGDVGARNTDAIALPIVHEACASGEQSEAASPHIFRLVRQPMGWEVINERTGKRTHFPRYMKGLAYFKLLIENPGERFHPAELIYREEANRRPEDERERMLDQVALERVADAADQSAASEQRASRKRVYGRMSGVLAKLKENDAELAKLLWNTGQAKMIDGRPYFSFDPPPDEPD